MIDELELAFEEHPERGRQRHRHRRSTRRREQRKAERGGGGRARTFIALFLTLALFGALAGGAYWGYDRISGFFNTPDYTTGGTGHVTVQIATGASATDIANTLFDKGVVKSAKAFVNAARDNRNSQNIQPGFYGLRLKMRAKDALGMLLDLNNKLVTKVTVPEGMISLDIYAALSKASKIPLAQFTEAAKNPAALGIPDFWFKRGDGKQTAKNLDGFLYPATYEFNPGATAKDMLTAMVTKFNTEMTNLGFVDAVQRNLSISPYEALIAASIAQAEAVQDKDMPLVARVLYNRAYGGKFACSCLGLDSAINYYLRLQGKDVKSSEKITTSDQHNPKDPYNTYDFPGMPLGPISNPGEAALKGAMSPTKNDNTYFVTIDKQGTMAYATSLAGHNANIQKACRNGIPLC